jgi:6-phosphogluconolactonase (cycloisomerase 2 family)
VGASQFRLTFAVCILAALLFGGPADAAVNGALKYAGCWEGRNTSTAGCTRAHGLAGIGQMATDSAAQNLYVTGTFDDALAVFSRNGTTGALTQQQCFAPAGNPEGCTAIGTGGNSALTGITDVVVSHDGKNVYTAALGASTVAWFSRTADGTLTYQGCISSTSGGPTGCGSARGLLNASAIGIDHFDKAVFAAGFDSNMIGVLHRDAMTGALTQPVPANPSPWCASIDGKGDTGTNGQCQTDTRLNRPHQITGVPDGSQVLVANKGTTDADTSIAAYSQALDGSLSPATPCANNVGGGCAAVPYFSSIDQFAVDANGSRIYVASRGANAILVIDRNTSTGAMTPHPGTTGCMRQTTAGCTNIEGSVSPYDIQVTGDGKSVFAGTANNHSILAFDVQADGGLEPKPAPFACVYGGDFDGCMDAPLDSPFEGVTVAGQTLYTGLNSLSSGDRLLAWGIDRSPSCAPGSATVTFQVAATVSLPCSDADGDTLTYAAGAPAHGVLGGIQPDGSVSYSPFNGFLGGDSFSFSATETVVTNPAGTGPHPSASITSDSAAFSLDVVPPPAASSPPDGGTPGPTPTAGTPRVNVKITARWAAGKTFTRVKKLRTAKLPSGAAVQLRCRGGKKKGCPFASKRVKPVAGVANFLPLLKKAKLKPRAVVEVWITKPFNIGQVARFTVQKNKRPKSSTLCLTPGSLSPSRCA